MELRFDHLDELVGLLREPPATGLDRRFVIPRLKQLEDLGEAVADLLDVSGVANLKELVIESDNTYGFLLRPREWGYQAVAYWRTPPLPGLDRETAINDALRRER